LSHRHAATEACADAGTRIFDERARQDEGRERLRQQKIRRQLDEALADSFPASDPVSIVTSQEEERDDEPAAAPLKKVPPTP
jgi:hypothetical protein